MWNQGYGYGDLRGRECVRNELARIFIAYHVQTSNQPLAIDVDEISEARFASADELEQFNWISPAMHELAKSGLFNDSPLAKIDYSTTQSYPYLVHVAKEEIPI